MRRWICVAMLILVTGCAASTDDGTFRQIADFPIEPTTTVWQSAATQFEHALRTASRADFDSYCTGWVVLGEHDLVQSFREGWEVAGGKWESVYYNVLIQVVRDVCPKYGYNL